MPRKRVIDADALYHDEELVDLLGTKGLHLYIALWGIAEDWGGFEYQPKSISRRMGALNFTARQVENYITKLVDSKKIIRFSERGRDFCWLINFKKHQPLKNPSMPQLPLPPWITCKSAKYKSGKKYGVYSIETSRLPVGYQDATGSLKKRNETETDTETETYQEKQDGETDSHEDEASGPPSTERETYDEEKERRAFNEHRKHLEEQCERLMRHFAGKNGEAAGFNPAMFVARAKKALIPLSVVKDVLDSMVRQMESIRNPWGWIQNVLQSEYAEYSYAEAMKEHEDRKKWTLPEKIGRFLGRV